MDENVGLPSNLDAEKAVLGSILLNEELIIQAIEFLVPEDFYSLNYRKVFETMTTLFEGGQSINPILIAETVGNQGKAVGGLVAITGLMYGLPHTTDLSSYIKVLRDKNLLRQLIKTSVRSAELARESDEEPERLLEHIQKDFYEINGEKAKRSLVRASEVIDNSIDDAVLKFGGQPSLTGIDTGFVDFNEKTGGLQKQDLIICAARPSIGKTSLAMMIAQNATRINQQLVVVVFSLEMSKELLGRRMIAAEARINSNAYRDGYLTQDEWGRVYQAQERFKQMKIFIDDTPGENVQRMKAKCIRLKLEQKRLDLIIVDFLQLMTGTGRFESRQLEVAKVARDLKNLAKILDAPLLALSQLSRAPEQGTDKRPSLHHLRDSGEIEQNADVVTLLYRTADQTDDSDPNAEVVTEVIFAKNRNGPKGTIELRFDPPSTRFDNLYKE